MNEENRKAVTEQQRPGRTEVRLTRSFPRPSITIDELVAEARTFRRHAVAHGFDPKNAGVGIGSYSDIGFEYGLTVARIEEE